MGKPQMANDCPDGLQYLALLNKIIIKEKISMTEVLTGWEMNNKYQVLNDANQQVYFAAESTFFEVFRIFLI
uniref:Phospholipid scramblase n=1 Tax=Mesocestoides corti TaxID=53468 RepID=A0A5K3FYU7_MESCO